MSRGQKQRTPENFPCMKDRAAGRRARKAQREAFYILYRDPEYFTRLGRALTEMVEALSIAFAEVTQAFADGMAEASTGLRFGQQIRPPRPLLSVPPPAAPAPRNPEDVVIDAINGLEADEIGERVRWQLEEGMRRGDHLPDRWMRRNWAMPSYTWVTPRLDRPTICIERA